MCGSRPALANARTARSSRSSAGLASAHRRSAARARVGRSSVILQARPRVEGGIAVAPRTFGRFACQLIAPNEHSGRIFAFDRRGRTRVVSQYRFPAGGDIGVESVGFVPPGSDRRAPLTSPTSGHPARRRPGRALLTLRGLETSRILDRRIASLTSRGYIRTLPLAEKGRLKFLYLYLAPREHKMSRGFPSMTALLGLLAVAGYQNRDKLAEMLGSSSNNPGVAGQSHQQGALGGLLGNLGGGGVGGLLGRGLSELIERFTQNGEGEVADSWVRKGPNQQVAPHQLEQAIGPDVLDTLSQKTGLSREELLSRLSRNLPDAVDQYTPDGRLPAATDFSRS